MLWCFNPSSRLLLVGSAVSGAVLALALVRSRLIRHVLVGEDSCTVPCGFLRLHPKRIAYRTIREVGESVLPFNIAVLRVRSEDATVEILAPMLKDAQTYASLRSFFFNREWEV